MRREHYLIKYEATLIWLGERPEYCNRGRYHANLGSISITISDRDWWPRYYFDLAVGKSELQKWLTAHGVDVRGARWVEREYNMAGGWREISRSEPLAEQETSCH